MTRTSEILHTRKIPALLLCLAMVITMAWPVFAHAENPEKTVKVGWYESPFNQTDDAGRRSGYAYEYQQKIAAYTGWKYEYVEGSWPQLMEKLAKGEIDLMSDVSYTEERAENMLFPSLPMGAEKYVLFISPDNGEIDANDVSTINGKKIGINKGSVVNGFYREWAKKHDVEAQIVEVTGTTADSLQMLTDGEIDVFATLDSYGNADTVKPIAKIGSADFYFALSKDRSDLLSELDAALSSIQDENTFYNQQMSEKYLKASVANLYLSEEEQAWLDGHGPIRVGYQDNYLAFCAQDEKTGELTGALKDYLEFASTHMENAQIPFEAVCYPTVSDAMKAMEKGEVDCVFPANFTDYDAEIQGVVMTPSLMRTEMYAVVRAADQKTFAHQEQVTVAVNQGNPNYEVFLQDHFPEWEIERYVDTPACLQAIAEGGADCLLISNYRYNNIEKQCEKLHLTTVSTGVDMDYCFAVERGETLLYSIISKTTDDVPESVINAALTYYSTEDAKVSFREFIRQHLAVVLSLIIAVLLIILALLTQSIRERRKASAGQQLISATENDELTGLYNRSFFFEYAARLYRGNPFMPMDAIVMNIEQFHSVNELNGRDFGDRILQGLGREIHAFMKDTDGIAGRFEADRFDIYCRHLEDYQALFDRMQGRLDKISPNADIRLRMGVMPWQEGLEPVLMFDRARTACTMARGHYQAPLIIYDDKLREREVFEQRLLSDLRRAVDEYQFEVHYQPKYDIQAEPPRIVSAEALVRWRHPVLGMIAPGDFVPLFERNGQIGIVDRYVWAEAARQIARWRDKYGLTIPVSVNLSRIDVFDAELERTLDGLIEKNGLDRTSLKLEVTESAYTENADQVIRVIERLRQKGYEIEMDDFGSGYSSLNMLSSMPIDVLKMDRAFIKDIGHDEKDAQLVALILDIAKNLKVPVIAEGVETELQIQLLKDLGCSLVQGYYFSRPLPPEEFEETIISEMLQRKG